MTLRISNHFKLAGDCVQPMLAINSRIKESGLEARLLELVDIRASQINGCAFCLHMHTTEARTHGESEMRIHMLPAWRESTLYTARERAALAWCECLTLVAQKGAPDMEYRQLAEHFTSDEQVHLTMAIGMINTWNRFQIGFAAPHPVKEGDVPR